MRTDGRVVVVAYPVFDERVQRLTYRIPAARAQDVMRSFYAAGFWSFPERYPETDDTHDRPFTVGVKVGGRRKIVTASYGSPGVPPLLFELVEELRCKTGVNAFEDTYWGVRPRMDEDCPYQAPYDWRHDPAFRGLNSRPEPKPAEPE
jgi:hypothetical protein